MNIYAVYDRIAQEVVGLRMYVLMCFRTDQEAARYFADAINDTTSMLHKHPADYQLMKCGTLDEDGTIHQSAAPELIITGDTLVALQEATKS